MRIKVILLFVTIIITVGFLVGCTETNNKKPGEESRFVGTWKSEDNPKIIPVTLVLNSDGTSLVSDMNGTWELKDGQLIVILGNNDLVSVFDYFFTEDDTVLHLRLSGNEEFDIYFRQLD